MSEVVITMGGPKSLSARVRRTLIYFFQKDALTLEEVSAVDTKAILGASNFGKTSLAELVEFLRQHGYELKHQVSEVQIKGAITLLERHGYTVIPPK